MAMAAYWMLRGEMKAPLEATRPQRLSGAEKEDVVRMLDKPEAIGGG